MKGGEEEGDSFLVVDWQVTQVRQVRGKGRAETMASSGATEDELLVTSCSDYSLPGAFMLG